MNDMNDRDVLAAEGYQATAADSQAFAAAALPLARETLDQLPPLSEEQFYALTPAEQRVRLAREVQAEIRASQLKACAGNYVHNPPWTPLWVESGIAAPNVPDLQAALLTAELPCEACALGSLLLTKIKRFNRCRPKDLAGTSKYLGRTPIVDHLAGIFPSDMLDLIEAAFEREIPGSMTDGRWSEFYAEAPSSHVKACHDAARMFDQLADDDEERLLTIMQHLIDHNGEFPVPPVETPDD